MSSSGKAIDAMSDLPRVTSLRDLSNMEGPKCKFVVVTGGTLSGLGKGTCISSLGVCLKSLGVHVTSVKIDPYLNVDAGTMSPFEHGECFVLADGTETDLDLGNYERMLNVNLTAQSSITTGKLYTEVMEKERRGDYLGKTVQIVPHVTDHLASMLIRAAMTPVDGRLPDLTLIEVGGTVGDIEGVVFLEALSRLRAVLGRESMAVCHLGYVPLLYGEQKTKPTQSTVRQLRAAGLEPNYIMVRCHEEMSEESCQKIAVHCNLPHDSVISIHDVPNMLMVPLTIMDSGLPQKIVSELNVNRSITSFSFDDWRLLANRYQNEKKHDITMSIVAKYAHGACGHNDTYMSLVKAIKTAAESVDCAVNIQWVNAEVDEEVEAIAQSDCVIIPGGFGDRGIMGKIRAVQICRESKIPLLGICLGLQMMAIEFARNSLGHKDAMSEEMDANASYHPVIFMPETRGKANLGGTMVLGDRLTKIRSGTLAESVWDSTEVNERHRHRYEINPETAVEIEKDHRYVCSGYDEFEERVHILEIANEFHPFFIGVQFHPEFSSKTLRPAPIFQRLVQSGITQSRLKKEA